MLEAENTEWFIEDQAFSPSYDMAPPPTHPFPFQLDVSLSQSSCVSPVELADGVWEESNRGGGGGGGPQKKIFKKKKKIF